MWNYICPRCRREVKPNSHQCPHCGERFPFPLKVPPKCLKGKEELERFVHEKVFPKVSAWQREYLAQYFTILFQDGFESGDFSAWTGVYGSPEVSSADKHHGSYGCYVDAKEGPYKDLGTSFNTLYGRAYFKLTNYPGAAYYGLNVISIGPSGYFTDFVLSAGVVRLTDEKTYFYIRNGFGGQSAHGPEVVLNQWYCIEIKFNTSSDCLLYVNGEQAASVNAYPLSANRIGLIGPSSVYQSTGFLDCVVVADEYIGPEGQVYEININAVSQSLAAATHEATYNIAKDASTTSQSLTISETTYNILKDAAITSQSLKISETTYNILKGVTTQTQSQLSAETTFNILKDSTVNSLVCALVEVLAGITEIFREAIATAQALCQTEATFNINKDALAQALTQTLFELGITKDATVKALTASTYEVVFTLPLNAIVKADALSTLQSTFHIRSENAVKVHAEVSVVKPTQVRVTRLYLVIGDLAIQIQGV